MLSEREERVLDAVIRTYVETAEPAGSHTVAKRFGLGVSPATIRNAMAELEEKGFLYHPHTSAGRIPTDQAYRYYVDTLMTPVRIARPEQRMLRRQLAEDRDGALDRLIQRAVQVLGLVTGELGVAIAPKLDDVLLERLDAVSLSAEKALLVLTLKNGLVRAVYVDLPIGAPQEVLASVTVILNERLSGQTLAAIKQTLPERLRDAGPGDRKADELLNIFVQSADQLLDAHDTPRGEIHLGRTSVIANQPEFADESRLRQLIELTEERGLLASTLAGRAHSTAPTITIGVENGVARLANFTLVTSEYRLGNLTGVMGVIGPTRMPYEKVAAIVGYTSRLVSELMPPSPGQHTRYDLH
ncbi:MAG: heat-inducible transcriptional repressor HrcA [Longimicrobiales bacterium]